MTITMKGWKAWGTGKTRWNGKPWTKESVDHHAASAILDGTRFGRLVVVRFAEGHNTGRGRWYACVCDCGVRKIVRGCDLRAGHTKSCGCHRRQRIRMLSVRLTSVQVAAIRARAGEPRAALAREFHCSERQIQRIIGGEQR